MRKIISTFVIIMVIVTTSIFAYAGESHIGKRDEVIVSNFGGERSNSIKYTTTIEEIDELVSARTEAYLNEDYKKAEEITKKLHSSGMQYISMEEFSQMTGQPLNSRLNANMETVFSTFVDAEGVSHDIMRIYVEPKNGSNLYRTGTSTKRNSFSAAADSMTILGISAVSPKGVMGTFVNTVDTVYSFLKSLIESLTATTTITDIEATYVWNIAQTCVFLYEQPDGYENWVLLAVFSKVNSSVLTAIPTLEYGTNGVVTDIETETKSGELVPKRYNNTADAVAYGSAFDIYEDARIDYVDINGIENKRVIRSYMLTPTDIGDIT